MDDKPVVAELDLDVVRLDGGTQFRKNLDQDAITDFATNLEKLPPGVSFFDGDNYWLADGFHRYHAHRKHPDVKTIRMEVRPGTLDDAILYALGCNADHNSVRLTTADKRQKVTAAILWNAEKGWGWNDTRIAEVCRVHHSYVSRIHAALKKTSGPESSPPPVGGRISPGEILPPRKGEKRRRGKKEGPISADGPVARALAEGKLSHRKASAIAELPKEEQAAAVEAAVTGKEIQSPSPVGGRISPGDDALGNPIPDTVKDVFGDKYLQEAVKKVEGWVNDFVWKSMLNTISKRLTSLPYLKIGELQKQFQAMEEALEQALFTLKNGMPWCVCLKCQGKGCDQCRKCGHWPEWRHTELYGAGEEGGAA